ncbi:MAG TPA: hypothetical protein VFT45_02720 [Longimicrobium sp.]|nr:hypothetical protein [Longimicrobium sp.]
MKKLKLDVDHLEVQSFTTGDDKPSRGTVQANGYTDRCATNYQCTNLSGCCFTNGDTCAGCGGGSLAYTQCEPETCDPFICGPY